MQYSHITPPSGEAGNVTRTVWLKPETNDNHQRRQLNYKNEKKLKENVISLQH